jgi:hypothetical protein
MSALYSGSVPLRLFECVLDRGQTELSAHYLPEAPGVMMAGEDLLRAARYVPGSHRPRGWEPLGDGFMKRSRNRIHLLGVRQCGCARCSDSGWANACHCICA